MKIEFYDIDGKATGTVTVNGSKLVGSNPGKQWMVEDWTEGGRTAEQFVEKFSDWDNGYAASKVVSEV